MNAEEVWATGGASGITGIVLFLVYRFCFSKHRIKSMCCGKEVSIETNADTPKEIVVENPMPK
jgi:hypothetical protein